MPPNEKTFPMGDLVRIGAEGLKTEEILSRLCANYDAHNWPEEIPSHAFIATSADAMNKQVDERFLLYQLERLDMTLTLDMQPSGLPLVGSLIDAAKRALHQLVLFYVNKVAARIATANMIQTRLLRTLYENHVHSDRGEAA